VGLGDRLGRELIAKLAEVVEVSTVPRWAWTCRAAALPGT
jgi:hypothetical protein